MFRVLPAVVDVLHGADDFQAIVGQLHAVAVRQEQVTLAVLADDMAGVDTGIAQRDGIGPGAAYIVGVDHVDVVIAGQFGRDVQVVAALVLGRANARW
eukprot:gene29641-36720_t